MRQQLTRFSEINPEEYSRLQEAERQMEEASAKKVATVAAESDCAQALVLALRKELLLERAFSEAEGRTGGDGRGTFFDVFKGQLGKTPPQWRQSPVRHCFIEAQCPQAAQCLSGLAVTTDQSVLLDTAKWFAGWPW